MDEDITNESLVPNRNEEDIINILVATDIHLGYAEDDPVRGQDTFNTFEEILQHAVNERVDFILLGGDLFHHAQPSPYCLHKCMELLKKYCLGDTPVSVEFLSDPVQNFKQNINTTVNYEDPNLNVSLPVFSIHGNHDDPTGKKHISALDLLSTSGLVNYFGIWESFNNVEISPILLQKGNTKLALYGLSHIRDERLGRLFLDKKVKMLHPPEKDDWFHLLVWHQNRAARGNKNFIPDNSLPDFLDLVIWGHEHDCMITPIQLNNGVHISQPGSSVATSLTEGESITKKIGVLKIHKNALKMHPIELRTVRPFIYAEMLLKASGTDDYPEENDDEVDVKETTETIIINKINSMINEAKRLGRTKMVSDKPLIRLLVKYHNEAKVFNAIKFGQQYVDKVANPESVVKFQSAKAYTGRKKKLKVGDVDDVFVEGPVLADRVEDLVTKYFSENDTLRVFPLDTLNECVKRIVDCGDNNALIDMASTIMADMLEQLENDLPSFENFPDAIESMKNTIEQKSATIVNKLLDNPNRQRNNVNRDDDEDDDDVEEIIDNNDDVDELYANRGKKQKAPSKGTRGKRAPRGRGKVSAVIDLSVMSDDSDNGTSVGKNKKAPSRGKGASKARKTRGATSNPKLSDEISDDEDMPGSSSSTNTKAKKNAAKTFWNM